MPAPTRLLADDETLRIGFFGQISALKGIDVLFDTASALARQGVNDISFEVHGDYRGMPPEFQTAFLEQLGQGPKNVTFHGPYDRARVDGLMQSVHAVLVPSVWWKTRRWSSRRRCATAGR